MLFLLSLLLSAPEFAHACDVLGYQGSAQLIQVGEVVTNEVHGFKAGQLVTVGRLVGGLIQRFDGVSTYTVVGRFNGGTVLALGAANQFTEVGKIDGDQILALTGPKQYTQAGAVVSCLGQQAAAGALLLVLRPSAQDQD